MPRTQPFVLIVVDHDAKKFCVEGPMVDDRSWNDAICDAQEAGRNVSCHTPGGDARSNVNVAAESYDRSYLDFERVAAGAILQIPLP